MFVNKEGTVAEALDSFACKSSVWTETNCQDNHVHIVFSLVSDDFFNFTVTSNFFHCLTKCQLDTVVFHVFSHHVRQVAVIVTSQAGIHNVDEDNFFALTLEGFCQFNTDVTSTNNRYTFDVFVFQTFDNIC